MRSVTNYSSSRYTAVLVSMLIFAARATSAQTNAPEAPLAQKPSASLSASDPVVHKGLFTIDAVAIDATGKPVSDLEPSDFKLLDNDEPTRIRTFSTSAASSEPTPELIFVVDTINLSSQQQMQTQKSIFRFLQRESGPLSFRCSVYRLAPDGLSFSLRPLTDRNLLVDELEERRSLLGMGATDHSDRRSVDIWESGLPRNKISIHALGAIAISQRDVPGRKVVIWIGPGWPVDAGEISFDEATELSTRLREARITLDNVNVWLNLSPSSEDRVYVDAPRSQKDMQPAKLAIQAIATRTGGLVLDSSSDLDQGIDRCVKEVRSFYTLTFDPPRTQTMDEYHELRVKVDRPSSHVRVPTGYYNEPVYFDNPRPGVDKVTVAELEGLVHSHHDLSRRLANLELTERLSTPRLDALLKMIHSEKDRQALTADADLSIALAPPPDEILNREPPSLGDQRAILRRTIDYLQHAIHKLPDFYALRTTSRFEEPPERNDESWKIPHHDQTLRFATGEHATVRYRNGHEVVEEKQKLGKHPAFRGVRARSLQTRGTFGPILSFVLTAAASNASSLSWKHWERGNTGDLAVFTFRATGAENVPELTFCCLPEGNGTTLFRSRADDDVEFAVDPETGAIMRIVITADLNEERDPDVPLVRSQIMVEYGPQELGGKTYICPERSVEVSRGRSERQLHEWGMTFSVYSYFESMINDMSFGGYHKFGSQFRILPGYEEPEETKTSSPSQKKH